MASGLFQQAWIVRKSPAPRPSQGCRKRLGAFPHSSFPDAYSTYPWRVEEWVGENAGGGEEEGEPRRPRPPPGRAQEALALGQGGG